MLTVLAYKAALALAIGIVVLLYTLLTDPDI